MAPQRTLADSMQGLSLDDSKPAKTAISYPDTQPKPNPKPARWPKLPEGWQQQDRYFALGWDIKHPRLQEFVKMYTPEHLLDVPYLIRAPEILERGCCWRPIHLFTALPQDASPPEPWDDPDCPSMTIIAISFTSDQQLYDRRPTREQYDWLSLVFGCRPEWYRDVFPKKYAYFQDIWP
ncbi:uncharacterized protein C8Q71DRAFT_862963 [Rhodofomes roseus]|uniref:Uncharacterized protein n=1 Tax=Rhodofomes roseus TaxID=34475 RepID=A0ABQ8JZQ2_9APHY|nr:uncharacterized protein C8Q71DRAFT_862963 [Rhodofomes roseus]KAH9829865.1 hypothetical protein C8Q71DRAFT_862963 [Rhodofomes roseus]